MFRKKLHRLFVFSFCISILLLFGQSLRLGYAEESTKNRNDIITMMSQKWQSMFGRVDFSDEWLFNCMTYLHPQPMSNFDKFDNEVLSKEIRVNHDLWITRFFKGAFSERLKKLRPTGYYLNEGRTEPSLLLFETQFEQNEISLVENYNLIFLTLKPNGYEADKGIAREDVTNILINWTNADRGGKNEFLKRFSLPKVLKAGYVFTNNNGTHILYVRDWRDYIVGFIADHGICFMLFKLEPNRAQLGFTFDFNWLNRGLFKKDGKTLVNPPR